MKSIELYKVGPSWVAGHFEDETTNKPDAEIVAAFGTHVLPTAFTVAAHSTDVRGAIAALNPGKVVRATAFDEEDRPTYVAELVREGLL